MLGKVNLFSVLSHRCALAASDSFGTLYLPLNPFVILVYGLWFFKSVLARNHDCYASKEVTAL